jgi:hypothetical protein
MFRTNYSGFELLILFTLVIVPTETSWWVVYFAASTTKHKNKLAYTRFQLNTISGPFLAISGTRSTLSTCCMIGLKYLPIASEPFNTWLTLPIIIIVLCRAH